MSDGTASSSQMLEFASAVVRQLPREIDGVTAQGWIENQDALQNVLKHALCPPKSAAPSSIIHIDRSQPFDPAFVGKGWEIAEQDERVLALTEVNLNQIRFETGLESDESWITGEEKLKRLKNAGHLRLDAKIFQTLWQNQSLIPESWKEKINGNTRYIFFVGTVLRSPFGYRYVLYLYWHGGQWYWNCSWLGHYFSVNHPSVVLAS